MPINGIIVGEHIQQLYIDSNLLNIMAQELQVHLKTWVDMEKEFVDDTSFKEFVKGKIIAALDSIIASIDTTKNSLIIDITKSS